MNINDLKYLVAVAQTQHFGQAAERCFITQHTLSMQLKKLEAELNAIFLDEPINLSSLPPLGNNS